VRQIALPQCTNFLSVLKLSYVFSALDGCWKRSTARSPPMVRATGQVAYPVMRTSREMPRILGAFDKLRKSTVISSCLSVRLPPWNSSIPIGRIFTKFGIDNFFETPSRKFVSPKSDKNNGDYTWRPIYEGWNFNSGNYLFTTDTK